MQGDSEAEGLLEELVVHLSDRPLQHLVVAYDVLRLFLVLHLAVCDKIAGSETCLPSRRDKDNDWLAVTKFFDVVEGRLIHGRHSRAVVLFAEALKVNFDRDWSH